MKNQNPSYLNWLLKEHRFGKFKALMLLYGIIQCVIFTDDVFNEWYYGHMPLLPLIATYIVMYGFVVAIALQPFNIYRRLVKLDWWNLPRRQ